MRGNKSKLEDILAFQMQAFKLPPPRRELAFAEGRRWRFDFAWPDRMLAVEVEGGTYSGGRHVRGAGFEQDCLKYNAAAMLGWRVLRVTGVMVTDGRALEQVERAIRGSQPAKRAPRAQSSSM